MTTRFVTVGDDLTLPADVVVPVAQVHGAGTAAAADTTDFDAAGTAATLVGDLAEGLVREYSDLSDVDTTGLADGDAMVWDQASGKWVRVPLSSTYVAQPAAEDPAGLVPLSDGLGGYSWAPGGSGGLTLTDNGDGTLTITGTSVVDNGDGTLTL